MGEARRREDIIMQQNGISRCAAKNVRKLMSIEANNGVTKEQMRIRRNRKYANDPTGMFSMAAALGAYVKQRKGVYKATKERHAQQSRAHRGMGAIA